MIVDGKDEYSWRPMPQPQHCMVEASPTHPSEVNNITINSTGSQGKELVFNVSWLAPQASHGRIVDYQLQLLTESTHEIAGAVNETTVVYNYNTNVSMVTDWNKNWLLWTINKPGTEAR